MQAALQLVLEEDVLTIVMTSQNHEPVLLGAITELRDNSPDRPNLQACIDFLTHTPPARFKPEEVESRLKKMTEAMTARSGSDQDTWARSLAAAIISSARVADEWFTCRQAKKVEWSIEDSGPDDGSDD